MFVMRRVGCTVEVLHSLEIKCNATNNAPT